MGTCRPLVGDDQVAFGYLLQDLKLSVGECLHEHGRARNSGRTVVRLVGSRRLVHEVGRDERRLIEDVLGAHVSREHDMNHGEYEVLVRLDGAKGRTRMAQLASQVVATPSKLTYTVDRLEARGWVRRRSLASDGRVVVAELTPEGRAALGGAAEGHADLIRRHLLSHMDVAETDALAAAMGRVIDSVRHKP